MMHIKPAHLDEPLSDYEKPEDLRGEDGLFKQLKKALVERASGAELTHHLGYEKGDLGGRGTGNNRNGSYAKAALTEDGSVEIDSSIDQPPCANGLRQSLRNFATVRPPTPGLDPSIQLASRSWQYRINATYHKTRTDGSQPIEAPQLEREQILNYLANRSMRFDCHLPIVRRAKIEMLGPLG